MKKLQELMYTGSEQEMIPSEIYSTIIEAVRANLVGTQLVALRIGPGSIPGSSIDLVTQDTGTNMTVHEIAEGAEIPFENDKFSSFNLKPIKYGHRPLITKEMIEDNQFDILSHHLQQSGFEMAKKLDSLIMAQIEAGASAASNTVSGGSAITVGNITNAMRLLEAADYKPTDIVFHPNVVEDIRNIDTFVEANKAGVANPSTGLIGTIFDMNVYVSSQVTTNYAYVIDRNQALVLAEKRPITVEQYDDVTRDLRGIAVTARWKCRYLRQGACSVITTT